MEEKIVGLYETQEENLRASKFNRMHLTPENEKIAHTYLTMENEENC